MKYVQYIETDGSEIAFPLTNAVISSIDCQIHFEYVPLNGTVHYDAFYTFLFGLNNQITFRTNGSGYKVNNPYQIIFGNAGSFVGGTAPSFPVGTKYSCILDKYGINVNGTQYNFTSPATSIPNLNCVFNGEYNGTRIIRCPLARYISLKVVLNGNDICNYKAAVDDNNVPCFYDEVSQTYAYKIGSGTPTAGPDIVTDTNLVLVNKYKLYTSNIQKTYNGSTQINKMYVGNDLVYRALPTTTPQLTIPLDEVWYKSSTNSHLSFNNGNFIDENGNTLTYTETFDTDNGIWKMKFSDNVCGLSGGFNNFNLIELYLPLGFVYGDDAFLYWNTNFKKFYGDSPSIIENGNMFINYKIGDQRYNNVIETSKDSNIYLTVPEGVTKLNDFSFKHTKFESITLPSTLTYIERYCFQETTATDVYCYATTKPSVSGNNIWHMVSVAGTFHYPNGSDYSSFPVPSGWTKVGDL